MNTNVNYYISAFDKNGKRLASHILNKSNDNKEIEEKKELLKGVDGVEVIEVISAEDFAAYLNGKVRDTETGKPVDPPEQVISDEEKLASQANTIAQKYSSQIAELKDAMITAQENDLTQLRIKLKMLKGNSTEQIKQLDELSRQLAQTKQSLMSVQVSLTECKNELETSRQSLEILKVQIRKLEKKQTVTRRQRDVYATLFALSVAAAIARR